MFILLIITKAPFRFLSGTSSSAQSGTFGSLKKRIETYFTKKLTDGRIKQGLEPFNYTQISGFINKHNDKINDIVTKVDADISDVALHDYISYNIHTDVNAQLENMSIINYYDLKFTFDYVICSKSGTSELVFMFYNCIILEPGFTKFTKGYLPGTRVNAIDINALAKNESFYPALRS